MKSKAETPFGFDYEAVKNKALEQLKSGKPLLGKEGALAPLFKSFLEAALEAELESHLQQNREVEVNRRNGHGIKQLRTSEGSMDLSTPRDRSGSFEPEIVKKRQTILADNLEHKIIGLYGLGMSLRDISSHIKEMYDSDISHSVLSEITDRVIPAVKLWQSQGLDALYTIVWLDAMYYKVKDESGQVTTRCLYNVLGIDLDGRKHILGMYVSESEGAKFWLRVLTDLQQRGVKDILIACIDNLGGFEEAIGSIYPKTEVQSCIVHQIRNTLKYVVYKDSREVMTDIKKIYQAPNKQAAEIHLDKLEQKWSKKYPAVTRSWRNNWHKLSTFFKYSEDIRRLIYTTNTIEGYHRQIRKVTKTKGAFPHDMALLKLVYLTTQRIMEKWTKPLPNWSLTIQQLSIMFEGRMAAIF
ncbi:IS256 family transposase [Foetidibacter luteolus]|uniref:IS256 family transposase n=2 Tax=Foetidibacter luteolus TaxID=2608880 RepID=UPI00129B1D6A|nr:IS256 family transposase [Foetidibacter luteolus]